MAFGFSFFKTPKHRVFNYQPLYYDERKEKMKERIDASDEEKRGKDYKPGRHIKGKMRKALYEGRRNSASPTITRIIVLISIIGLMIMAYYVAQYFGLFFSL